MLILQIMPGEKTILFDEVAHKEIGSITRLKPMIDGGNADSFGFTFSKEVRVVREKALRQGGTYGYKRQNQ
jgi:hypothetical protein